MFFPKIKKETFLPPYLRYSANNSGCCWGQMLCTPACLQGWSNICSRGRLRVDQQWLHSRLRSIEYDRMTYSMNPCVSVRSSPSRSQQVCPLQRSMSPWQLLLCNTHVTLCFCFIIPKCMFCLCVTYASMGNCNENLRYNSSWEVSPVS